MNATLLLPFLLAQAGTPPAPRVLPFSDAVWELQGPSIARARHDGQDALDVETGIATRRDVRLEDGTIDLDVELAGRRSFVYVTFRMEADGEHEEVYLRPHKSGLPDALQYAPVFQGQSAWQLYHGPGKTAAAELPRGVWTHVRLVIQGRRAALFLGDGPSPALLIDRLAREPRPGYIALKGFVPPGTPGQAPAARFANVRVRPGPVAYAFPPPRPEPKAEPGVVRAWAVSSAFLPLPSDVLPDAASQGPVRPLDTGADGLLELHRLLKLPPGGRAAAAVASLHIHAASAGTRAFDLGFSDEATVVLNGRPLFTGEAAYSFDNPRREGLIGFDQARLYLPLSEGDNELRVLVSDSFGGWGLMGRFADPSGLTLEAR